MIERRQQPGRRADTGNRLEVHRLMAALLWLCPAVAHGAQLAPHGLATDPVLAELIEQSLSVRPEVAQALAAAKAEHERVPQVGAPPDPMLQLGVQNDSFTSWNIGKMETSWYSVMASQTFPWPGKLRLRSEVAELDARQADQNVNRVALSTEADVRKAYLALMLARDRQALLDRLEAVSQHASVVAQARYEAGTAAQSDVLRAQLELKRIQQRRWALQVEADTQSQTLNRLRNHPLSEPIRPATQLAGLAVPVPRDEQAEILDALERSPELASASTEVIQGSRSISLARRSYWPDFTVNLGVMPRGGDFPPMWLANVGFPIPVFAGSRQDRAVAESEARLSAAQSTRQALEQVLRLRVRQRRSALTATLETLRIYREGLLAQSEATAQSTLAQYEVGKVGFISVLEANAGSIADQDSYLQVLAQAARLEIDAAAVSLDPPPGIQETAMSPSAAPSSGMQPAGTSSGAGMPAPTQPSGSSSGAAAPGM